MAKKVATVKPKKMATKPAAGGAKPKLKDLDTQKDPSGGRLRRLM